MNLSAAALVAHIAAFAEAWGEVDLEALSSEEFLAFGTELGRLRRAFDHAQSTYAGELSHRSAPHLEADGLARRAGHSKPGLFLAELWQISPSEGARLCAVGEATRETTALDGSALPARYPVLRESLT